MSRFLRELIGTFLTVLFAFAAFSQAKSVELPNDNVERLMAMSIEQLAEVKPS